MTLPALRGRISQFSRSTNFPNSFDGCKQHVLQSRSQAEDELKRRSRIEVPTTKTETPGAHVRFVDCFIAEDGCAKTLRRNTRPDILPVESIEDLLPFA